MDRFKSHYDFLDEVLPELWVAVRGTTLEQDWCSGIVSAHGDKCRGYLFEWGKQGIPFYLGALTYMFSYSASKPTHPIPLEPLQERSKVGEWVVRQLANEAYRQAIERVCSAHSIKL